MLDTASRFCTLFVRANSVILITQIARVLCARKDDVMNEMEKALPLRRSIYALEQNVPLPDERIQELLAQAVRQVPSAFNMQSQRAVLLLENAHHTLWKIALDALQKIVPAESFARTQQKIASFDAGHGTILFFDDTAVTNTYAEQNPEFKDNFALWAQQANGMLQYAVWVLLAENKIGASLQHYNPLIDDEVRAAWNLPAEWKLVAQMPFGGIGGNAGHKDEQPLEQRLFTFR